jgi:hypothetical protein
MTRESPGTPPGRASQERSVPRIEQRYRGKVDGIQHSDSLAAIADGLALIKSSCEQRGLLKLFDNHVVAQHFFCRFLNAAFGLQLVQMDEIRANYPAIDLGDLTNRVAYQVTTERRSDKVQHTLNKFVEHGLEKHYDTLRILIIGDRQATYKSVVVPSQLSFDCDRDIMGIEELVKYLGTLDSDRLGMLQAVLAEELRYPTGSHSQPDDDTLKLDGHLTVDQGFIETFGCPGIRFTLISRGKRPAKIRGAVLCVEGGPFLPTFEKAFGTSLGAGSPPPGLEKQTLCLALFPLFQPSSPDGIILQRDDVCHFFVPMELPALPPFLSADAKDVSIRARFFDESELPVLVGEEVQGVLKSLVEVYGKKPYKLKFPLRMEVKVHSMELPGICMTGMTNPHPLSFVDDANLSPQDADHPVRLALTLAVAQNGSAYTIGVPVRNTATVAVERVAVSFLAKVEGKSDAQRIPFVPASEEALAPGQHREFIFPFEALPELRNLVATLPANRYGVLVETEKERCIGSARTGTLPSREYRGFRDDTV